MKIPSGYENMPENWMEAFGFEKDEVDIIFEKEKYELAKIFEDLLCDRFCDVTDELKKGFRKVGYTTMEDFEQSFKKLDDRFIKMFYKGFNLDKDIATEYLKSIFLLVKDKQELDKQIHDIDEKISDLLDSPYDYDYDVSREESELERCEQKRDAIENNLKLRKRSSAFLKSAQASL